MLVAGVGSVRSTTIFDEAAATDNGDQTSVLSDPLRSEISRKPNSLRVGKVSETFASPVNHALYMISQPYAEAKLGGAEAARVEPLADGSTVEASMTFGLVTWRN